MDAHFKKFVDHFSGDLKISEKALAEISRHLSVKNLRKKQVLVSENQLHDFAYFVIKGAVRGYYLKDGVEVNTWFALENEMVGSLQNYLGRPSRETIELMENSTLVSIDLKHIKPMMFSDIEVANFINAILADYALFLEDRLYFSQMMSSMERYQVLLSKEPQLFQRVPLTFIASFLGISRETLSRLRAK